MENKIVPMIVNDFATSGAYTSFQALLKLYKGYKPSKNILFINSPMVSASSQEVIDKWNGSTPPIEYQRIKEYKDKGYEVICYYPGTKYELSSYWTKKLVIDLVDKFITSRESQFNAIKEVFSRQVARQPKFFVVPYPVSMLPYFQWDTKELVAKRALYHNSRWSSIKSMPLLLDVMPQLVKSTPNVDYGILGHTGNLDNKLEALYAFKSKKAVVQTFDKYSAGLNEDLLSQSLFTITLHKSMVAIDGNTEIETCQGMQRANLESILHGVIPIVLKGNGEGVMPELDPSNLHALEHELLEYVHDEGAYNKKLVELYTYLEDNHNRKNSQQKLIQAFEA